jgi:ubiquitin fusion degradation protein 1
LCVDFAVIMPPSALEKLSYLEVEYPMQFRVTNPSNARVSHVGVLEFVADEGFIHVPAW